MSAIALGVGLAGAAASVYGANKQKKSVDAANTANAGLQAEQNQSAWNAYLLSRGINPTGAVTGQIPQNAQAVNTRLPLWATASFKKPGAQPTWRKKGSGPTPNSLVTASQLVGAPSTTGTELVALPSNGSKGPSKVEDFLIGNPLGIGGKDRNFLDPFGIF